MTSYEQYQEVAKFVRAELLPIYTYIEGEVIDKPAPYMVLKTFGVGNEYANKTRMDTMGYSIHCYAEHRGKAEKLVSDTLNSLMQVKTVSGLSIEDAAFAGFINRLEDDLYEGIVSFSVESNYIK